MFGDIDNDALADDLSGEGGSGGAGDDPDFLICREADESDEIGFGFRDGNRLRGLLVGRGIGGVNAPYETVGVQVSLKERFEFGKARGVCRSSHEAGSLAKKDRPW